MKTHGLFRFIFQVLRSKGIVLLFLLLVIIPKCLYIAYTNFTDPLSLHTVTIVEFLHLIVLGLSYYYFAYAILAAERQLIGADWSASVIHKLTITRNLWIIILVEILAAVIVGIVAIVVVSITSLFANSVSVGYGGAAWLAYSMMYGVEGLIAMFVVVRLLLISVAVVLEEDGPMAAVRRSWTITRGHFMTLLVPVLLLAIPAILPWLVGWLSGYRPATFNTDWTYSNEIIYSNWGVLDWSVAIIPLLVEFCVTMALPAILVYYFRSFSQQYDSEMPIAAQIEQY